jgi:hypothetical protein
MAEVPDGTHDDGFLLNLWERPKRNPKVGVNGLEQRDSTHGLGASRGPVHALHFVLCIRWWIRSLRVTAHDITCWCMPYIAGAFATMANNVVFVPMDVVKHCCSCGGVLI